MHVPAPIQLARHLEPGLKQTKLDVNTRNKCASQQNLGPPTSCTPSPQVHWKTSHLCKRLFRTTCQHFPRTCVYCSCSSVRYLKKKAHLANHTLCLEPDNFVPNFYEVAGTLNLAAVHKCSSYLAPWRTKCWEAKAVDICEGWSFPASCLC